MIHYKILLNNNYSESIISQYIQSKLEFLFTDFNKDDNGCPHHLDKLLLILLVV